MIAKWYLAIFSCWVAVDPRSHGAETPNCLKCKCRSLQLYPLLIRNYKMCTQERSCRVRLSTRFFGVITSRKIVNVTFQYYMMSKAQEILILWMLLILIAIWWRLRKCRSCDVLPEAPPSADKSTTQRWNLGAGMLYQINTNHNDTNSSAHICLIYVLR